MRVQYARLSPQAVRWGDFDCGDARITGKLAREALRAEVGLQALYGVVDDQGEVLAAMTLRAGVLAAEANVLFHLGQGELDVPTLHIEALAVRTADQRRGIGRALIDLARTLSEEVAQRVGVRTLSLEATPESRAFYTRLGFDSAATPWPGGSWPMWIDLWR